MSGLTPTQIHAMKFVEAYLDQHGFAPTVAEIAEHMGHGSKSSAHRVIDALVQRGYLKRTRYCARAMEIARRLSAPVDEELARLREKLRAAEQFREFVLRHTVPARAKAHGYAELRSIIANHPFATATDPIARPSNEA